MHLNDVLEYIDRTFSPSTEYWKELMEKAENVKSFIYDVTNNIYPINKEDIHILGSVPRKTFLKDDFDVDIFLLFTEKINLKEFIDSLKKRILDVKRNATVKIRYAEHPYLEVLIDDVKYNIVPAFKTNYPNWMSPMDRSYHHHRYLIEKGILDKHLEVIRLKVFLKAVGVYGAEVTVNGFSGYLTELLIVKYGSFTSVIENITRWSHPTIIDIEGFYSDDKEIIQAFGSSYPLIVIDPVDRGRNVSASVSKRSFSKLISATNYFINNPSTSFITSSPHLFNEENFYFKFDLDLQNLNLIGLLFMHDEKIEDIHYSQAIRIAKKIKNILEEHGFKIFKFNVYSDFENKTFMIFLLESLNLPYYAMGKGPYPFMKTEADFIKKNVGTIKWIGEDGRWYVLRSRKYRNASKCIKDILENRLIRIPEDFYNSYKLIVIDDEEHHSLRDRKVNLWLRKFLVGDEYWTFLML